MKNKIKIFELFAGIGAPRKALDNLGISYESLGFSEIDNSAVKAYCSIHNDDPKNNFGDITKIEKLPNNIDLLFHGSPCQDFSLAGLRKGGDEGSETRSSLMWETVRLIKKSKPKIVIWENVTGALSDKMKDNFNKYLFQMEELGYINSTNILTGTDFNVPQIRKRVFVVSFLNKEDYKNIRNIKKIELTKKLSDFLDDDVDAKYFLSEKYLKNINIEKKRLNHSNFNTHDRFFFENDAAYALRAKKETKVLVPEKTKTGFKEAGAGDGIYLDRPHQKRGTVQKSKIQTLKTSGKDLGVIDCDYKVRYLTPKEYYKLMGFTEEDFENASKVIGETALYKTAGNSIIVQVLEGIFNLIYKDIKKNEGQQTLF